jgi:prepilin-type N-terminal cleavage/methylation domain-containing protein
MINGRPMSRLKTDRGYSLIELVVVIIIIGILAGIAVRSLRSTTDTAKVEQTKRQMERIAFAIAGDPNVVSGGVRTSYGYVGDIGGLPANLDALITSPGGYTTWKGPYILDELSPDASNTRFKLDGWGKTLTYSGGITISSTGGGVGTITRSIAPTTNSLLRNQVVVVITDLGDASPGTVYRDSVKALFDVPNGVGGTTTKIKYPSSDGYLRYDSIPVGEHLLRVVYSPNNDTLRRQVHVDPGSVIPVNVQLFREVW